MHPVGNTTVGGSGSEGLSAKCEAGPSGNDNSGADTAIGSSSGEHQRAAGSGGDEAGAHGTVGVSDSRSYDVKVNDEERIRGRDGDDASVQAEVNSASSPHPLRQGP